MDSSPKDRVVQEKAELDARLQRLELFITTTAFKDLPLLQQDLMKRQSWMMRAYSSILRERLEAWE